MSTNKQLDPYTAKAEENTHTPQEKVDGLHQIVKKVKTGMLTTRDAEGHMHTRAMAPAGRTCTKLDFSIKLHIYSVFLKHSHRLKLP
jgi:general stress protein 26